MSEDKFEKCVKKYLERFKMDKEMFFIFIATKIDLNEEEHNKLTSFLENKMPKNRQFNDQELREFLHYASACQQKVKLENIRKDELNQYKKLKYKTSTDKKQGKDPERKEPVIKNKQEQEPEGMNKNNIKNTTSQRIISDEEDEKESCTKNKEVVVIKSQSEEQGQKAERTNEKIEKRVFKKELNGDDQVEKGNKNQSNKEEQIKEENNVHDDDELLMIKGKETEENKELIKIPKFEKFGQDMKGPIIKFQIIYQKKHETWRRYSEIEKVLNYLKFKYEGIVLPEMPPKEGIKGNFNFLWFNGVNEGFLDERREKIKNMLNKLLSCAYVAEDNELERFLTEDDFNFDAIGSSDSYLSTLVGLKDIVFNYSELMNYGTAYYNYITDYKKKNVETECTKEYERIQAIITSIISLNDHRKKVNSNFENRREIMLSFSIKGRELKKTDFDNILEEAEIECNELNKEFGRYLQLKSTEGWESELIKQKSGKAQEEIKETHKKTQERIKKLEYYLMESLKKFGKKNEEMLNSLGGHILEWRKTVHP